MKKILLSVLVFVGIVFFLIKTDGNGNEIDGGIGIYNWSYSIGTPNEKKETVIDYTVYVTNENKHSIRLISIKPILDQQFIKYVDKDKEILIINKTIESKEALEIKGVISLVDSDLSKQDFLNTKFIITDFNVIFEEFINIDRNP